MLAIVLSVIMLTCSWYGPGFDGNTTANGEVYDQTAMTAAHRTLPFDTILEVRRGNRCAYVRINDRGPYSIEALKEGRLAPHPTRDLDLSKAAFKYLAPLATGVMEIEVREVTLPLPLDIPPPEGREYRENYGG